MRLTVLIEGINLEKLLRAAQEEGIVLFAARRMDARSMRVSLASGDRQTLQALCEKSGISVTDDDSYINAVCVMLDRFAKKGCRFVRLSLEGDRAEIRHLAAEAAIYELLCEISQEA